MIKIYLVCLSYLCLVSDVVRCKPDYKFSAEAGGWLKLHRIPATWQEAFLRCHYEGAVLASPLHKHLVDALSTLITKSGMDDSFFLGTHNFFSKDDYVSVEGVPLSDMEIKWGGNNLKNATKLCLIISSKLPNEMQMSSCMDPRPYICFRKLDNLTMNECGTFDKEYQLKQRTGSCYKVHYEKRTWSTAYEVCAAEGGHLVVLNDEDEARIVTDMFPPAQSGNVNYVNFNWEPLHIGLLAWGEDRTWLTIHGERVEDVFHTWYEGQPDNCGGNQHHGALVRGGALDDHWSQTRAMFVCEKSPESIRFENTLPVI